MRIVTRIFGEFDTNFTMTYWLPGFPYAMQLGYNGFFRIGDNLHQRFSQVRFYWQAIDFSEFLIDAKVSKFRSF